MSTTQTPVWVAYTAIDDVVLSAGDVIGGDNKLKDLTTAFGAWLYLSIARLSDTALAGPVNISVMPYDDDAGLALPQVVSAESRVSGTTTAITTTVDVDSGVSQNVLSVASTASFAVGETISISSASGLRLEFAKIAKIDAGVSLTLRSELFNDHTSAQADIVANEADVFNRIWLPGGTNWYLNAEYGEAATGADVAVRARMKIWTGNTIT